MPARVQAPKKLPYRSGLGALVNGHYNLLVAGAETVRPGLGVFHAVGWTWGSVSDNTFMSGRVAVRLAGLEPKEGDRFGQFRPSAKYIYTWCGKSLMQVPGYDNIPEQYRQLLEENEDVVVESNLAVIDTTTTIGSDLQIIPLIPDEDGNIDLAAARAQVDPPGAEYYLHLGTVDLRLRGDKQATKVKGLRLWTSQDTIVSMLHEDFAEDEDEESLFNQATRSGGSQCTARRRLGLPQSASWFGRLLQLGAGTPAQPAPACASARPRMRLVHRRPAPKHATAYGDHPEWRAALCGGREIGETGNVLLCGADELRIHQVVYNEQGQVKYATMKENAIMDFVSTGSYECTEMLTVAQAEQLVIDGVITDPATVQLLQSPRDMRPWLRGATERMPGWRTVRASCARRGLHAPRRCAAPLAPMRSDAPLHARS